MGLSITWAVAGRGLLTHDSSQPAQEAERGYRHEDLPLKSSAALPGPNPQVPGKPAGESAGSAAGRGETGKPIR